MNPSAGFSFGAPATTTTTATGFGFGGLGTGGGLGTFGAGTTTTTTPLFGGFGLTTTTTTTAPAFSFTPIGGINTTSSSFANPGGLGTAVFATPGTTFGSTLGTFGSTSGGLGRFGTGSTFGSSTFGATSFTSGGLGATSSFAPTLGGTGLGTFSQVGSTLGGPVGGSLFSGGLGTGQIGLPSQAAAPGAAFGNSLTNLAMSLSCPLVFGDERDVVLAKWNKLQAYWGIGKGIFNSSGQFVEFTPDNPFCRFKAIGYSCIPTGKNEDGLFALTINKKSSEIIAQQQQLVESLHRVLGSKQTLNVCIEGVKAVSENKTEVVIFILERAPTGASRRIPTSEVFAFLNQPNIKMQLSNLGIEGLIPKSVPTKEQLEQYLQTPPAGIDSLLWQQGKLDNPDPENLIPVPVIGFSELQLRLKYQEQETRQHQGRLDIIAEDIVELQRKHSNMLARIAELKRKQLELGHRVLQVMVKQETTRKLGYAIQADEEQLRVQLEAILAELSAPTQFKGRLNELMSQIRMQNQQTLTRGVEERCLVDANLQQEIKQLLKQQQEGLSHLVSVIRDDLEDLRLIEQDLKETAQRRL